MTSEENVDNTVDKPGEPERKGVLIPGAVWPVPGQTGFTVERRDPFTRTDRDSPLKRRSTDIYEKDDRDG
jgi:hypothetical protein